MSTYLTVAIPYVNAAPHLGYAFELVAADLAARARRARGEAVRFLGGTDDLSLKNVLAAESAGEPTQRFVDRHADRFAALTDPLAITFDDFIRTSSDPRHRPGVERLWRACRASGDLYERAYTGCYCVGCEQFYEPDELDHGRCPEHGTPVDTVTETNWFFRLSRHSDRLLALIEANELRIDPAPFRNEIIAFVRSGLRDISVSRSIERAHGWGIAVPDDPTQVIYVWFDALANYISALGFGTGHDHYERWWRDCDDRIHVVGKGILRFHAVYWPAFLLSAGEPLPTRVHVHPYLTVDGAKISKSAGGNADPTEVVAQFGGDALRWWFARDTSGVNDTDFTVGRLVGRVNDDLANGIGNAVNRVVGLARRHRDGPPRVGGAQPLPEADQLAPRVHRALADLDRRTATDLVAAAIVALNRHLDATAPWHLAREPGAGARFDAVIASSVATIRAIADAIRPITPQLADAIVTRLANDEEPPLAPVFPRLHAPR